MPAERMRERSTPCSSASRHCSVDMRAEHGSTSASIAVTKEDADDNVLRVEHLVKAMPCSASSTCMPLWGLAPETRLDDH